VEAKEQNYGVADEVVEERAEEQGATMVGTQGGRTWSVVSHLSVFLDLVTGFLGPVAAFIIWLVYKDRPPQVACQALQSAGYQVAWLVLLGVGWALTGLLTLILVGFLLIPVMALATVVPLCTWRTPPTG